METQTFLKIGAALLAGVGSAIMGWYGWILIAFGVCMMLDYLSGTAAACKTGTWSSRVAREGIWHKVGTMMTICAAVLVDAIVGLCIGNIELPFEYTALISPIVTVWYCITEIGSICENAGKLGAPVPNILTKAVANLKKATDQEEKKE